MTFLKFSNWLEESLRNKDLEEILEFIKSLDKKADIEKEVKKKYPKLEKEDLELILTLI